MKTKISLLVMLSLGLACETPAQPANGLRDGLPTTIRVTPVSYTHLTLPTILLV